MGDILASFVNLVPVSLIQSLIYAFVSLGIMIPFRLLSFPDLTAEGSFPLGACLAAALLAAGFGPGPATLAALVAGALAGVATALIHLKLRINTLLAGILVLTMLFSVDIRIMGKPNIPLFAYPTLFSQILGRLARDDYAQIALLGVAILVVALAIGWVLRTEAGVALRAVGANPAMARAQGIDTGAQVILGLAAGNALTAFAGALLAQNQGFADVNLGFGVLINGLAALILGETLIGRETLPRQLAAPIIGSIGYYQVISLALAAGIPPSDLKFLTGVFVLATLAIPALRGQKTLATAMRE